MATHCSDLAWETPWTEEPGGTTVCGVTKSWTRLSAHTHTGWGKPEVQAQFPQAVSLTSPHLFRHKMIRYEQGVQMCTTLLTSEHGSEEMMKSSMLSSSK